MTILATILQPECFFFFESQWAFNEALYNYSIDQVINMYFRDDDKEDFKPIFLLNDLIRYWRVMTLTYERGRTRYLNSRDAEENSEEKEKKKNKDNERLKNKKLKFNRIWLCYSAINPLISQDNWTKYEFKKFVQTRPYDRLRTVSKNCEVFQKAADSYMNFLIKSDALTSPVADVTWGELDSYAQTFRNAVKTMVETSGTPEMRGYLLV